MFLLMLYALSSALGVAELGITSRASEWVTYGQLGVLAAVYLLGLMAGVVLAGLIRLPTGVKMAVGVFTSAVPVIGIGALLVASPHPWFPLACALWSVSGVGSGLLDNTVGAAAVEASVGRASHAVGMLAGRHVGTLLVTLATAVAVSHGFPVGQQYILLGAAMLVPLAGCLAVPNLGNPGGRPHAPWGVLVGMGAYLALSVLPTAAGWAYTFGVMGELGAGLLGGIALGAFVVSEATACLWYLARSRTANHNPRRAVVRGLVIASVGALALSGAAIGLRQHMPAAVAQVLAIVGLSLLGWGVAPLPMVVPGVLRRRGGDFLADYPRMVVIQTLLGSPLSLALGQLATRLGASGAIAAMALVCAVVLLVASPLLRD